MALVILAIFTSWPARQKAPWLDLRGAWCHQCDPLCTPGLRKKRLENHWKTHVQNGFSHGFFLILDVLVDFLLCFSGFVDVWLVFHGFVPWICWNNWANCCPERPIVKTYIGLSQSSEIYIYIYILESPPGTICSKPDWWFKCFNTSENCQPGIIMKPLFGQAASFTFLGSWESNTYRLLGPNER